MVGCGDASDSRTNDADIGVVGERTGTTLLGEGVRVGSGVDPEGPRRVRDGEGGGVRLNGTF